MDQELQIKCTEALIWNGLEGSREEGILRQALTSPEKEGAKESPSAKEKRRSSEFFETVIESNGAIVAEGSEYTAQLLSQISSSILPTMSSSQVSSVLSALEPLAFEPKLIRDKSPAVEFTKNGSDKEKKFLDMRAGKTNWFKCCECPFLTLNSEEMSRHLNIAHSNSDVKIDLKCIGCALEFKSSQTLTSHYLYDHHVAQSEVHEMVKETVNANKVWEEEKDEKEEKEKKLKCGIQCCAARFTSYDKLLYHRNCHFESFFKCPECSEVLRTWSHTANHIWKTHGIDLDLYACDECSYRTDNRSKLYNIHKRTHRSERLFACDECEKRFKNRKQVRNHKIVHKAKVNSYVNCDLCSRKFKDVRMLNNHTDSVHKGLRPYLCSLCGYSAANRSSLKMHTRTHSGEKPYKCDECEYASADHNSLRRHRMRHSGDKHYKCPHCPYASIQSTTFKAHLYNKHPGLDQGLMFSCSLCPFKTVKKDNYLTHMSYHVGEKEEEKVENIEIELMDEKVSESVFLPESLEIVKSEVLLNDRMLSETVAADD